MVVIVVVLWVNHPPLMPPQPEATDSCVDAVHHSAHLILI
jgi:hypothetical protein